MHPEMQCAVAVTPVDGLMGIQVVATRGADRECHILDGIIIREFRLTDVYRILLIISRINRQVKDDDAVAAAKSLRGVGISS